LQHAGTLYLILTQVTMNVKRLDSGRRYKIDKNRPAFAFDPDFLSAPSTEIIIIKYNNCDAVTITIRKKIISISVSECRKTLDEPEEGLPDPGRLRRDERFLSHSLTTLSRSASWAPWFITALRGAESSWENGLVWPGHA
jgi:hypothetical protein